MEWEKQVRVNWGIDDSNIHKYDELEVVDTSGCSTVKYEVFKHRILDDKGQLNICIVGNELKEYVGIGWVTLRVVTEQDLKKYPRVIQ